MLIEDTIIRKAIFEAIYSWQRSEYMYSNDMNFAYNNRFDNALVKSYAENSFAKFLSDFSVRRNISGHGTRPVITFISFCYMKNGFLECISVDNFSTVIDSYSNTLKETEMTNKKHSISLLSKTAFLLYPDRIPLYDSRAIKSIQKLHSCKINTYKEFSDKFTITRNLLSDRILYLFNDIRNICNHFDEFSEINDLNSFIIQRTTDKLLWLM